MKKTMIFGLVLISILVLSGCIQKTVVTCNKPYIVKGTECCLDQNDDGVCDMDKNNLVPLDLIEKCVAPDGFNCSNLEISPNEIKLSFSNHLKWDIKDIEVRVDGCHGLVDELKQGETTQIVLTNYLGPGVVTCQNDMGNIINKNLTIQFKNKFGTTTDSKVGELIRKPIVLKEEDFTFVDEGWLNNESHKQDCEDRVTNTDIYYVKYKISSVPEKYLDYDYFYCEAYVGGSLHHEVFGTDNNIASVWNKDEINIKTLDVPIQLFYTDISIKFCCYARWFYKQASNEICFNKVVKAPCK